MTDTSTTATGTTLTGAPGSRGIVTAPARVVRSRAEFDRVHPGDVLICPYTDPGWTPLFAMVAGIVTETGGVLSHAAIVAREFGIPAVIGIPGATDLIRDGERITIDGASGTVVLEDRTL